MAGSPADNRLSLGPKLGYPDPSWLISAFLPSASAYSGNTGILELMNDLSQPPADPGSPFCMLGGGNPAIIPEVAAAWDDSLAH